MKITNRQLRQIIQEELALEAKAAIPVRTASPEDYDPPAHLGAEGPRTSEVPQARVGNFFMRAASAGMPSRGYSSLKKQKIFYMILPDGEAIRVGNFPGDPSSKITSVKDAKRYLTVLDAGVTILPVSDFDNPTPVDLENMRAMADDIERVAQGFQLNEEIDMKITKSQLSLIVQEEVQRARDASRKTQEIEEVQLSHAGLRRSTPARDDRDPIRVKRSAMTSLGSAFARARTAAADLRSLGQNVDALVAIIDAAEEALDDLNIRI